jgi:hypothetical protein
VQNAPGSRVRIVTDGGKQALVAPVTGARFKHGFRLSGKPTWVRAEVYGEDAPDQRAQGCTAIFDHDQAPIGTYCTNRVAMQALSSAIYLH